MDPFFYATNLSKLVQQAESILLVVLIIGILIAASERLFGLDIRGAVDEMEAMQKSDQPWPLTILLLGGLFAVVWMVRGF